MLSQFAGKRKDEHRPAAQGNRCIEFSSRHIFPGIFRFATVWKLDSVAVAVNSIRIPTQQLPSGLYHLAVEDNEGWQTLKLIKQ